jgi:hypothetical protein
MSGDRSLSTGVEGATIRSLRALGFTDRRPEYASTKLGYDMGGWDLTAQEMVNLSMVPIVSVTGLLHTPRILADIQIQMLQTFDQPEMAAAFLVFSLDQHKRDLKTLPDWWSLGEANLDLHPVVQERKEHEERMKAWRARPQCQMGVDHARLFRSQLRTAISELSGQANAQLFFDGQVLRVALPDKEIAVLASGEAWPHAVSWPLKAKTKLPSRFKDHHVTLGFFEGNLDLENYRYSGATELW